MERIRIGLCDDEILVIQQLERIIRALMDEKEVEYEVDAFLSGEEIIKSADLLDVVFLDIEMPEIDGILTGKRIKIINPNCKIVMATSKVERFKEAFQIEALRFVTKPFEKAEIKEAIDAFFRQKTGTDIMELYHDRKKYYVYHKEIVYIMAYNGYLNCICNSIVFRKDGSLKEIYDILDKRQFVKISRNYIVNICFVKKYNRGILTIKNKELTVSRREKKNFEYAWVEYDLKYR